MRKAALSRGLLAGSVLLAALVAAGGLGLIQSIRGSDEERLAFTLYSLSVDLLGSGMPSGEAPAGAPELLGYALIGGRGESLALWGTAVPDPAIRKSNSFWHEGSIVIYHRQLTGAGAPGQGGGGQGRQIVLWYDPAEFLRGKALRNVVLYAGLGLVSALVMGVGILSASLISAQERMEGRERLALLGHASRTISHELQTPLTALDLQRQLAQKKLAGLAAGDSAAEAAAAIGPHLAAIADESARLGSVMKNVRKLVRPETGYFEPVELGAFAQALASALALPGKQCLAIENPGEPIVARADREQLSSILRNLTLNAAQSQVSTGADNPLSLRLTRAGRFALIELEDTGAGLSREERKKAFEPFYSTKPEGSGLGLPLSRALARAMGGELTLHARHGGGCLARLRLPLAGREDGNA